MGLAAYQSTELTSVTRKFASVLHVLELKALMMLEGSGSSASFYGAGFRETTYSCHAR